MGRRRQERQESDCDPYEAGAKMERRFTANHLYKTAGIYRVKVTLRKAATGRSPRRPSR